MELVARSIFKLSPKNNKYVVVSRKKIKIGLCRSRYRFSQRARINLALAAIHRVVVRTSWKSYALSEQRKNSKHPEIFLVLAKQTGGPVGDSAQHETSNTRLNVTIYKYTIPIP